MKFTSKQGSIGINASLDRDSNQVSIAISDTGVGIVQDKLDYIFEAFSQEDTSTTRKYGGTGLGLSISSSLIKKMGGVLELKSVVQQGSTFTIKLPIYQCEEEQVSKIHKVEDEDCNIQNLNLKGHILIVEDNKTNQMLLSMILDDYTLDFDIANDGLEALQLYNNSKYDIIFMDENMPNLNGIEATKQIRLIEHTNERTATPVIAVTANALAEDRERFIDAGMDDYISKPYGEKDILSVLKKYLA